MKNELVPLIEKFLRNEASAGEIARLKELFTQTEAEAMLSGFYEEKWESASLGPEHEMAERVWAKLQEQIQIKPAPKRIPLWRKGLRVAASILLPLCCVGLGYSLSGNKAKPGDEKMTVQVAVGQKATMQLPDGTHIWLNSASSLTYDNSYNTKERVVYLQGEAYFEVHKDKMRPFIVKADDLSVEALGTSFNVKAYPDDNYVMATLMEGSIRISSPFQSEELKPNEKLTFTKSDGQFAKWLVLDAEKNISWVNSQLAFEGERLEDIAKVLERMYSIDIRFASESLKNIRFSGTIKNNNLENVLQLITFVSPIRYSLENDTTIIIRNK